ncbi:MAG: peptidoglycan DD-metalloendopeptidase family protein [Oscillospiraceae bacterium]|nr:peptidoglycan DD-metalloendopeptidase family protein [Oscillospiraceae bacterium]
MESSQNADKKKPNQKRHRPAGRSLQDMAQLAVSASYRFCYYVGVQLIRSFKRYKKRLFRFAVRTRLGLQLRLKKRMTLIGRKFRFAVSDAMRPYRQVQRLRQSQEERLSLAEELGPKAVREEKSRMWKESLQLVFRLLGTVFNYVAPVVSFIILITLIHQNTNLQFALEVEYNDKMIGYIAKESDFDESEKIMQSRIVYEEYQPPLDTVPKYTLKIIDEEELSTVNAIADELIAASGNEITEASGLYVNGTFYGAVEDATSVRALLDGMLDQYRTGSEDERVDFVQDVQLSKGLYLLSSLVEPEEMEAVLTSEVAGEVTYTVVAGDAPTLILPEVEIPYLQLKALHPGIEESLLVGQEVLISNQVNFLTVKRTVTEVYEEDVPFGTEEVVDANYAKGYQAVRSSGVLGKRLVTADVVYVNGMETDRTELEAVVLQEPVNQVVTVGTAEPIQVLSSSGGSSSSSGSFIWPVDGGYLSCGINGYWGHTGMDIAAPRGTVIRAAASGTVVKAVRQYYAYGIHVKISHGNGVYTLYGHMSQLAVSYGDYVQQGQIIGYVGMTGNASGNHCHFEIIINGRFMDPSKYIGTYYPGR